MMGTEQRVVVVSNRVPPPPSADEPWPAGGLVSAVQPALEAVGGIWFGWSGEVGDPDAPPKVARSAAVDYITVDLSEAQLAGYYEGFANRVLWPLLHTLPTHACDGDQSRLYDTYRRVNHSYAQALLPYLRTGDRVWVHDYHLIPLGTELRALGWAGALGYFHHVPIPLPETWDTIPRSATLARDLRAFDLVGVQTRADAKRLRDLLGPEAANRVRAMPIGIDPDDFREMADAQPEPPFALDPHAQTVFFGVDRLDYTKGIRQRLEAFERLIERCPEARRSARFVQWAAPSRGTVPEYQDERVAVEEIAARINKRFGYPHPVHLAIKSHPREVVAAGLHAADVCVVTSLADGMNLVAKEFASVHSASNPGVLILSDACGAAEQLADALLVRGAEVPSIEAAMERALRMPLEERRRRAGRLRTVVDTSTVQDWFDGFLAELDLAGAMRRRHRTVTEAPRRHPAGEVVGSR